MGAPFLTQLGVFSSRYLEELECPAISPWRSPRPAVDYLGCIVHWTADRDIERVLKWFHRERYQAKASAHFVVDRGRIPRHDSLAVGLPAIEALPCTVVSCVPIEEAAWHATAANPWSVGIEVVNAGKLKNGLGHTRFGMLPPPRETEVQIPERSWHYSQAYHSYTFDQVMTVGRLLTEVDKEIPMRRSRVLGHSNVQKNKQDPGPDFPINALRSLVFPTEKYSSLKPHTVHEALLATLGYDLLDVSESVRIFQKMMSIDADGIVGLETRSAILARFRELFY